MSKRNAVAYVKPSEPAFLTAFKKRAGIKEGPSIDAKREELELDADQVDREDERPTVVVLNPGDLTEQEAEQAKEDGAEEVDATEEEPPADGKIRFKKPKKRSGAEAEIEDRKKKITSSKKVKNSSLLSFGDEEEEEDG